MASRVAARAQDGGSEGNPPKRAPPLPARQSEASPGLWIVIPRRWQIFLQSLVTVGGVV